MVAEERTVSRRNLRGRQFRKNEFISEDRLHNEIEYFKNEKTHLGAIEPQNGTLYKYGTKGRPLKLEGK